MRKSWSLQHGAPHWLVRGGFSGRDRARKGLGPAGDGKTPGFFSHGMVAIDADDETLLGVVHARIWRRSSARAAERRQRPIEEKESMRWIEATAAAGDLLDGAAQLIVLGCIRAGVAANIDLLIGSNTEETRLFLLSDGTMDRFTSEALVAMAATYGLPAEGLSAYRAIHPGASAGELFSAIRPTGTGASPPSSWPMPTPPLPAPPPLCMSLPGARRRWAAGSGLRTAWRYPSCSITQIHLGIVFAHVPWMTESIDFG